MAFDDAFLALDNDGAFGFDDDGVFGFDGAGGFEDGVAVRALGGGGCFGGRGRSFLDFTAADLDGGLGAGCEWLCWRPIPDESFAALLTVLDLECADADGGLGAGLE